MFPDEVDSGGGGATTMPYGGLNFGGITGGVGDLDKILKALGGIGKVNPLLELGVGFGGKLLGGLAGLIGGPSRGQKSAREVYNLAKNRIGQNILDPAQYMASFQQAMAPRFNQMADATQRRLGLDSGVAMSEINNSMAAPMAGFFLDTKTKNDQLKAQFDNQLLSLMGDISRYM